MGLRLEDFFPYNKREDRSPLSIDVKVTNLSSDERYRVYIIDSEGFLVEDNKNLNLKDAEKEIERLKKELEARSYCFK